MTAHNMKYETAKLAAEGQNKHYIRARVPNDVLFKMFSKFKKVGRIYSTLDINKTKVLLKTHVIPYAMHSRSNVSSEET